MGYPNKLLPKVTALCWTLEALHGTSDVWRGRAPDPHTGICLTSDRWVPTFPTSLPFFVAVCRVPHAAI